MSTDSNHSDSELQFQVN